MIRTSAAMILAVSVGVVVAPVDAHASIKSRAKRMSNQAAKLFAEKQFKAAAELFEQAYALDSAKSIRLRNAGRAYEEAKLYGQALHCFRRYIDRAGSAKLKEDAKTRIARMDALVTAKKRSKPVADVAQPSKKPPASVVVEAPKQPVADVAQPSKKPSSIGGSVSASPGAKSSRVVPYAVGGASLVGLLSGGAILWQVGQAQSDVDAAKARGDYSYPTGSAKLESDESTISLNRGIGWGLVGLGVVGVGVSAWKSLSGAKTATASLLPGGPGDGPGVTALLRF